MLLLEGFYEWQQPAEAAPGHPKTKAKAAKQPYYIYPRKGHPAGTGLLMVAGLWDCWGAEELGAHRSHFPEFAVPIPAALEWGVGLLGCSWCPVALAPMWREVDAAARRPTPGSEVPECGAWLLKIPVFVI